jgi:hypothetical protein
MKKAFVTPALVGFMVFTGQAASAGASPREDHASFDYHE